ncbi:Fic family protein [Reyranella sp.]|uniref:Fic family protein n=1 Tax=Reyranella sp. TaxID=1929291 RepID=UPI003BAC7667
MADLVITDAEVRGEYERWLALLPKEDAYATKDTLGLRDVIDAHFAIADFFYAEGTGMGGIGPKSLALLHSAMFRQHVSFGGRRKWTDPLDICATLMFGLIMDHPFHDANKRTAFLSSLYYLKRKSRIPDVDQRVYEDFTVSIADHALAPLMDQYGIPPSEDREVACISEFLRRNTRRTDKRFYVITFRELDRLLRKYNCHLQDPYRNYIDLYQTDRSGHSRRIMNVGFPGWTRPVDEAAIREIRRRLKLTDEYGVDSQSFFKGVEDLETLIASYQEPLRRLANR